MRSHVVTAADVTESVTLLRRTLAGVPDRAWESRAGTLSWTCWETVEHLADDLFAYAIQVAATDPPRDHTVPVSWRENRPGGPGNSIFADRSGGTAGLLQVLEVCGVFLASSVRDAPAGRRAYHVFGVSDPAGFAAMGVVETLVHGHDLALGLRLRWEPPAELCARALTRLFPNAPTDGDPWPTLLWATGRGPLAGRQHRGGGWRWDGRPAAER
jgi:hypothetical protein